MKQNIYQKARKMKGITQEHSAELLDVDVATLRSYELGNTIPNGQLVKQMVNIYNAQWLAYEHLENIDTTNTLPELFDRPLEAAMLYYQKESRDVKRIWDEAIDICHDGEISEDEKELAERIIKELDEEQSASVALKFALLKKIKEIEKE